MSHYTWHIDYLSPTKPNILTLKTILILVLIFPSKSESCQMAAIIIETPAD